MLVENDNGTVHQRFGNGRKLLQNVLLLAGVFLEGQLPTPVWAFIGCKKRQRPADEPEGDSYEHN
jgi:hypothetical protein